MNHKDAFCSHCGARHRDTAYPRTCPGCGVQVWANPIPVAIVLVPLVLADREGLLVVRRAIPPVGKLALPGGFIEAHEPWQVAAAREVREESGVIIEPTAIEPFWLASSEPRPDRLLVFAIAPRVAGADLPRFMPTSETSDRGVVFGPDGIEDAFAFPLHVEAVRRHFRMRGITARGQMESLV